MLTAVLSLAALVLIVGSTGTAALASPAPGRVYDAHFVIAAEDGGLVNLANGARTSRILKSFR